MQIKSLYIPQKPLMTSYHYTILQHSMSRAYTPTDNPAKETINRWIKEELFTDFNIRDCDNVDEFIDNYIHVLTKSALLTL